MSNPSSARDAGSEPEKDTSTEPERAATPETGSLVGPEAGPGSGEAPENGPATPIAGERGVVGPHLWQIRAVRDAIYLGLVLAVLGFALEIMQAVLPILIGFLGAYLVAPVIRWFEARGIRRGWVVLVTSLISAAATAGAAAFLVPRLVRELARLRERFPTYVEVVVEKLGLGSSDLLDRINLPSALETVQPLLGVVGSVVNTTATGVLFVVLFLTSFTVFNLEFEELPILVKYVPKSRRQQLEPAAQVVVDVFRGFLRGQLLVMLFTGTVYTVGFWLLGVPFGVFAGLVGGVLSIIPYGQVAGPILAIVFNLLESQVTGSLDPIRVVVLPAVVYAAMQLTESFLVTPLVQGAATRLHPLAILACLAAGGSLGGILGVFLAIPVTAAAWILAKERLLPAWRDWAQRT